MKTTHHPLATRLAAPLLGLAILASACGSDAAETTTADPTTDTETTADTGSTTDTETETETTVANNDTSGEVTASSSSCEEIAALYTTRGSANADMADPEVDATCDGDMVVVTSNGIPDYTYVVTSPGTPNAADYTFTIPASPTMAEEVTAVPALGTAAITLSGIPIYGPTEGTGGDVLALGNLSECGSHNGPTGFHIHLILASENTDCLFTPQEVAAAPQLIGYAFDGYPIYTGIDQYTSSWELTDESLFATDTWAAHSYVEGLGDLDECNGLTDANGNYAYYTTATFPYVIGCYSGVVDLDAAGGGGGGGGGRERP